MFRHFKSAFVYSVITLVLFCISNDAAAQATVRSVNKKNRTVTLSEGKNSGFEKGARVCIYTASDKKVLCAKIGRASTKASQLKLSAKGIARVRKGMNAKMEEDAFTTVGARKARSSIGKKYTLKAHYIYTPMTPINYNSLNYAGISSTSQVYTLWEAEPISSAMIGGGGSLGLTFSERLDFTLGFRYRFYASQGISSDYVILTEADKAKYVDNTQDASAMGGYIDYAVWTKQIGRSSNFKLLVGADVEMFTMKFEALQKQDGTDSSTVIAQADASKMAIGIRLGGVLNYNLFGSCYFTLAAHGIFVAMESGEVTAEVTDSNTTYLNGDANEDLLNSLDVKKGGAAAEVVVGLGYAF